MLSFLRYLFRTTLVLTVLVVVIVLYFSVARHRPTLRFNLDIYPPISVTSIDVDSNSDSEIDADTTSETDALLRLLTQRYWTLTSLSLDSNKTIHAADDEDKFFTPSRLTNLSAFNLLRSQALSPSSSVFRNDDRILAQIVLGMEGLPDSYNPKYKTIILFGGTGPAGDLKNACPGFKLNACTLIDEVKQTTASWTRIRTADAVIVTHRIKPVSLRTTLQIPTSTKLMYLMLESPFVAAVQVRGANDWLNSYWRHSDVVAPYSKWVYSNPDVTFKEQEINYAATKTRSGGLAAIFMSNCMAQNSRLQLVYELNKFVPVDVYGKCGKLKCPRDKGSSICFTMLQRQYKFYLAFENANCRNYMTEKLFHNALENNVVPIVLGAHPVDYRALAPRGSFIHVEDFGSVQELASYLKYLDENDEAYNSYFEWKGTGEFIDTKHFCRVCAMLHYSDYIDSLGSEFTPKRPKPDPEFSEEEIVYWDPRHQCTGAGRAFWNKSRNFK